METGHQGLEPEAAGEILVYIDGQPVKLKPEKKRRPANRKGKRVYTGEERKMPGFIQVDTVIPSSTR